MKLAASTNKPRRLRSRAVGTLLLGATIVALAGAFASAAGATDYNTYDIGRGSCHLHEMGGMGSGGNSNITTPASTWTNFAFPGHSKVTVRVWTIVIDVNGNRKNTYSNGAVAVPATTTAQVNVPSTTLDIPRSLSDFYNAKIEVLVASYDYYSNALLEVDTGIASSYWIYQGTNLLHDTFAKSFC
jgi:hypothetical protein